MLKLNESGNMADDMGSDTDGGCFGSGEGPGAGSSVHEHKLVRKGLGSHICIVTVWRSPSQSGGCDN